jgi:hypothetical protein
MTPRIERGVPAGSMITPAKNPYPPCNMAFVQFPACALGAAPTSMLAKTTNEKIVCFMVISLSSFEKVKLTA